jgi:hypothetical protein
MHQWESIFSVEIPLAKPPLIKVPIYFYTAISLLLGLTTDLNYIARNPALSKIGGVPKFLRSFSYQNPKKGVKFILKSPNSKTRRKSE